MSDNLLLTGSALSLGCRNGVPPTAAMEFRFLHNSVVVTSSPADVHVIQSVMTSQSGEYQCQVVVEGAESALSAGVKVTVAGTVNRKKVCQVGPQSGSELEWPQTGLIRDFICSVWGHSDPFWTQV